MHLHIAVRIRRGKNFFAFAFVAQECGLCWSSRLLLHRCRRDWSRVAGSDRVFGESRQLLGDHGRNGFWGLGRWLCRAVSRRGLKRWNNNILLL